MKIDRYELRLDQKTRKTSYFAIAGKKEYPMPDAFASMYDDEHLAIEQTTYERPEVFGLPEATVWVPVKTS